MLEKFLEEMKQGNIDFECLAAFVDETVYRICNIEEEVKTLKRQLDSHEMCHD